MCKKDQSNTNEEKTVIQTYNPHLGAATFSKDPRGFKQNNKLNFEIKRVACRKPHCLYFHLCETAPKLKCK